MQKKIWPFNILLIVNNVFGNPIVVQLLGEYIKVVFVPLDSTSLIQPMDEGVMSTYETSIWRKHLICW